MKYKEGINLKKANFKRLGRLYSKTSTKMVEVVIESQKQRQNQGRPPKIPVENQIMFTFLHGSGLWYPL